MLETAQVSIHGRIHTETVIYNGILFSIKRIKLLIYATDESQSIMPSKRQNSLQNSSYVVIHLCDLFRTGKHIAKIKQNF